MLEMEGGRERVLAMETVVGRSFATTTAVGNYRGSQVTVLEDALRRMHSLCLQELLDSRVGSNQL